MSISFFPFNWMIMLVNYLRSASSLDGELWLANKLGNRLLLVDM